MAGWWLATLVLVFFLFIAIFFIIAALKSAVNTEDAVTIDPLPGPSDGTKRNE
ncbi:hypothetical protein GJU40_14540 [Bacillus lacus]|uniref:Uncharacterized protein n=1 Tax=Metabacillus lacus TaxID=1983721 RepID=A0A7X2J165_9BACI|nr:hypothetical protein [Metabacillus lacus]MRX73364.1 hypothetical protein [Metabacillus lacus]